MRAALFALVGVLFFLYWVLADPSYDAADSLTEWRYVLLFSAALLALAFALPQYARLAGSRFVRRASLVAAAGAALGGVANVFEDGIGWGWAFWAFVTGTAVLLVGLLLLAVAIVARRSGPRFLALVPAATLASVIGYVAMGGPLMLATWLAAAGIALALPARA